MIKEHITKISKDTILVLSFNGINYLCSFILAVLISRYLGIERFGEYSFIFAFTFPCRLFICVDPLYMVILRIGLLLLFSGRRKGQDCTALWTVLDVMGGFQEIMVPESVIILNTHVIQYMTWCRMYAWETCFMKA